MEVENGQNYPLVHYFPGVLRSEYPNLPIFYHTLDTPSRQRGPSLQSQPYIVDSLLFLRGNLGVRINLKVFRMEEDTVESSYSYLPYIW